MPVGDVLVRDTGGHVEHDDTALAVDVVAITQTTELLLTSGIPDIELDLSQVLLGRQYCCRSLNAGYGGAYGGEAKRVNLDSESGDVLLLKLASQMALDEGGLERLSSQYKIFGPADTCAIWTSRNCIEQG
jgi:hypothetical protein